MGPRTPKWSILIYTRQWTVTPPRPEARWFQVDPALAGRRGVSDRYFWLGTSTCGLMKELMAFLHTYIKYVPSYSNLEGYTITLV